MSREVVVVSGVRTAIGTFGGSLKDIAPTDLAAQVVRESLHRANIDGKDVGHVVFGHVVNTKRRPKLVAMRASLKFRGAFMSQCSTTRVHCHRPTRH